MIAAVSNLDISWPDPVNSGNDITQKYLQCSNQYIFPTASADDAVTVGSLPSTAQFGYYQFALSEDGIIAIAPLLGGNFQFCNVNTGTLSTGAAKPGNMAYATYASWNNRFYFGRANPGFGIYWIDANSTGSSSTVVSGSTTNRNACKADGDKLWLGNVYNASSKIAYLNLRNDVITEVGTNIPAGNAEHPCICPNGVIVWGSEKAPVYWYDTNTDTVGTGSQNVTADSHPTWILARDGFAYSVPRVSGTTVWRFNPVTKNISSVYTGSPYTAANKKGNWLGTDGRIYTNQAANTMIAYDPITNTASTMPFTFTYSQNRDFAGITAADGSMFFLNATNQLIRVNNVNTRNLFNQAYQGLTYNKAL